MVRQRVRQGSALADVQDGRHHSTAPREDAHRREQPATTTSLKSAPKKVFDHTRLKQALLKGFLAHRFMFLRDGKHIVSGATKDSFISSCDSQTMYARAGSCYVLSTGLPGLQANSKAKESQRKPEDALLDISACIYYSYLHKTCRNRINQHQFHDGISYI